MLNDKKQLWGLKKLDDNVDKDFYEYLCNTLFDCDIIQSLDTTMKTKKKCIKLISNYLIKYVHFNFIPSKPKIGQIARMGGYDKLNMQFGSMKVLVDDLIPPGDGFPMHHHSQLQVFAYIVDGEFTHRRKLTPENEGETLKPGDILSFSAGNGVWHTEMNYHSNKICRFVQVWMLVNTTDYDDNSDAVYESKQFGIKDRLNKLFHIMSPKKIDNNKNNNNNNINKDKGNKNGETKNDEKNVDMKSDEKSEADRDGNINGSDTPFYLLCNTNVYVSELELNKSVSFVLNKNRQMFLHCIDGVLKMEINEMKDGMNEYDKQCKEMILKKQDRVQLFGQAKIRVTGYSNGEKNLQNNGHFIFVENNQLWE